MMRGSFAAVASTRVLWLHSWQIARASWIDSRSWAADPEGSPLALAGDVALDALLRPVVGTVSPASITLDTGRPTEAALQAGFAAQNHMTGPALRQGFRPQERFVIDGIDHLVLTVRSIEESCGFYVGVLGLARVDDPGRPTSVQFGSQKINLHEVGRTFEPKAARPTPGSGDICFVTSHSIEDVLGRLRAGGVAVEVGPVERIGARGPMTSVYVRDPDQNLVEIARYHVG